jgi:hypothetical protein
MSTLATHLACPNCGCTYFEQRTTEIRIVEYTVEYDDDGDDFDTVKVEDSPDYDINYVCGSHCGFETDSPEMDCVLNDEFAHN